MKRRKRSHMTEADCLEAFREFSKRVQRMAEGSFGLYDGEFAPADQLGVRFLVSGNFGVGSPLFEAIRVLGGHKLPAKEPQ